MKRMYGMPMHSAAHVLTRAHVTNACVWTIGNVSAFGTSKAYARRLGSPST
jgi:hypothetical protein